MYLSITGEYLWVLLVSTFEHYWWVPLSITIEYLWVLPVSTFEYYWWAHLSITGEYLWVLQVSAFEYYWWAHLSITGECLEYYWWAHLSITGECFWVLLVSAFEYYWWMPLSITGEYLWVLLCECLWVFLVSTFWILLVSEYLSVLLASTFQYYCWVLNVSTTVQYSTCVRVGASVHNGSDPLTKSQAFSCRYKWRPAANGTRAGALQVKEGHDNTAYSTSWMRSWRVYTRGRLPRQ